MDSGGRRGSVGGRGTPTGRRGGTQSSNTSSEERDRVRWNAKRPTESVVQSSAKKRVSSGGILDMLGIQDLRVVPEKENDSSLWARCLEPPVELEPEPELSRDGDDDARSHRGERRKAMATLGGEEKRAKAEPVVLDEFPLDVDESELLGLVEAAESSAAAAAERLSAERLSAADEPGEQSSARRGGSDEVAALLTADDDVLQGLFEPLAEERPAEWTEASPDGLFEPVGRRPPGCARVVVEAVERDRMRVRELTETGREVWVGLPEDEPTPQQGDVAHIVSLALVAGEKTTTTRTTTADDDDAVAAALRRGDAPPFLPLDDDAGFVYVAHPETFVTPTTVADATSCERAAVLRRMVSGGRRRTKAMVVGQLKHDCFRLAIAAHAASKPVTARVRDELVALVVARAGFDLYAVDADPNEASRDCRAFVDAILDRWARAYLAPPVPVVLPTRAGGGPDRRARLTAVAATEEPRFAPVLGVSGTVDVVVDVEDVGDVGVRCAAAASRKKKNTRRVPLELKTGKPHASHAAQVGLYVAMDRSLEPPRRPEHADSNASRGFGGLLLYPPLDPAAPSMEHVNASVHETRALLKARNRVADALTRAHANAAQAEEAFCKKRGDGATEWTPAPLPEIKREANECRRCFQVTTCAAYHAAIEEGDADSFGCGADVWSKALDGSFEDARDRAYFEGWMRALDLEAAAAAPASKQVLAHAAVDRERRGEACVSGLRIASTVVAPHKGDEKTRAADSSPSPKNADAFSSATAATVLDGPTYVLTRAGDPGVSTRSDGGCTTLSEGDFVLVSADRGRGHRRGVAFLDRGRVLEVDATSGVQGPARLLVRVSSRLEGRLPPDAAIRIDKDETAASTGAARANVLALFVDPKVDLRAQDDAKKLSRTSGGNGSENDPGGPLTPRASQMEGRRKRLRDVVVRLEPPRGLEPDANSAADVPDRLMVPGGRRFGGKGCSAEALAATWARLNDEQRKAATACLRAADFALVLGMPGTGKTSTIEFVVRCLIADGKRVLVASHTHAAVDVVLTKLLDADVPDRCVGRLAAESSAAKVDARLRKSVLTQGATASLQQLKARLAGLRVVGCTCLHAASDALLGRLPDFDVALVDEAGQIAQPVALAPLYLAKAFILVGDPHQLRPLWRSRLAADRHGAAESLFERLADAHPAAVSCLSTQYRMSEAIMNLANAALDGAFDQSDTSNAAADGQHTNSTRLSQASSSQRARLASSFGWLAARRLRLGTDARLVDPTADLAPPDPSAPAWLRAVLADPVAFVDVDARDDADATAGAASPAEVAVVVAAIRALVDAGAAPDSIAVLTPFRGQRDALAAALDPDLRGGVVVSTIDKYQGSDRDIVFVSLVKSKLPLGDLLADPRRVNVALTRAKHKLVLVGAAAFLRDNSPVFRRLVDYASNARALHAVGPLGALRAS